ncbi:prepilin peptidase [Tissierella sp. MB52-C2]|uniref:prepilin peptidase n=1 Tax=Tissierella sp. MB52-C2 TaxID=3070999 RepID=UPI00280C102C|nr:prepilin peptidase [Tissierella sp. MB52-C2]WMM26943.1 prepilin peptidase [Tissierella sp. MB52-C2]
MTILISLYGLLIGSFLNVCIYRIPRDENIAYPASHCPNCNTNLKWYDLIPVLSFIHHKGKCGYCREKISLQYPIVELLNSIIYLFIYKKYGLTLEFFFYAIIFSILITITLIDLKEMIIPDILVVLILGITTIYKVLSYILYNKPPQLLNSIGGLVLSALLFILIILVSQGGMGVGDATLIGSLGFILGIKGIFLTIFLSFILGAIISVFLLITKIKGRRDPIPFGPFIVGAFFIVVFWKEQLISWYISLFFY